MASQGYSIALYRDALSQSILLGQLANAYSASNFVTDAELESIAALMQQTRDFRYVSVTLGTRTLGTPISQEEIQITMRQIRLNLLKRNQSTSAMWYLTEM